MTNPFSFAGKLSPSRYGLWSLPAFFSQHVFIWLLLSTYGIRFSPDWWFLVLPLRSLGRHHQSSDLMLLSAFGFGLLAAWLLAAVSFRRAADAGASGWIATAAIVPLIQIPVILLLCVLPRRSSPSTDTPTAAAPEPAASSFAASAQGLIAGLALTLFSVAVGALVFGVYGYGIFVVSPFLVGAIAAYFANRNADVGSSQTTRLVMAATFLGGVGLVVAALEGFICIVLAAPLGFGAAWIGGKLGRSIALARQRSSTQALSGFAFLPLVFMLENASQTPTHFDTYQTIEINAPPAVVWKSILHMDAIEEPRALPLRLGVAYPIRGEVIGEGVGALRRGEFSTGTAIERVTEWVAERKLAFVIVEDVPSIRELSPYEHVHAPHAVGYFITSLTSFELVARPGGRTEIVERTSHQLKLDPILYWLPMARWIVDENNARVLRHIKRQAERDAGIDGLNVR